LQKALPRQHGTYPAVVRVTPRDRAERKCPVYECDHYEVQAFYTWTEADSLDELEKTLRDLPGVYLTTQVRGLGRNQVMNPRWPAALGASRRDFHYMRPQVLALIRD
jgi:hypothetical protein